MKNTSTQFAENECWLGRKKEKIWNNVPRVQKTGWIKILSYNCKGVFKRSI